MVIITAFLVAFKLNSFEPFHLKKRDGSYLPSLFSLVKLLFGISSIPKSYNPPTSLFPTLVVSIPSLPFVLAPQNTGNLSG